MNYQLGKVQGKPYEHSAYDAIQRFIPLLNAHILLYHKPFDRRLLPLPEKPKNN